MVRAPPHRLLAAVLLLGWAGLSQQESADLTPFHGFLPQKKLRALLPPGDPHPNDIYQRSRPRPAPIPPGFEIKYPDYKFTFSIPKDPERPVYIITEKPTQPAVHGHHACDGHGHGAMAASPIPATAAPPAPPTVLPSARPVAPRPARPLTAREVQRAVSRPSRPPFRPTLRPNSWPRPTQRPTGRPVTPFSGNRRTPVQLTSSATLSRPTPTVLTKPRSRRPPARPTLLTKSRDPVQLPRPRPTPRPAATKPPPTPSVFARMKGKLLKYPAEQYRVFPGGYARLSTYSSLSG